MISPLLIVAETSRSMPSTSVPTAVSKVMFLVFCKLNLLASDEVLCSASGRDGLITKDGIAEQLEGAAGITAAECDIAFTKAQYDITRCCLIEKQSGSVVDLVAGIAERVTCHSCGYFQGAVVDREDARIGSFSVNNQGAYTVFGQTAGVRTIECGAPGDVLAIGVHTDRAGAVEDA